ncbi:Hypp8885 [Branchiostoma lanceolatum]|uniref:Hypp8885 protein n=1 Tax=Branchiostoma lanceolatum TaxID=7740 RepID=A0A8J9ZBG7_BRALA|nr:Hypp8885 [Branchiostoma lanceolatum]
MLKGLIRSCIVPHIVLVFICTSCSALPAVVLDGNLDDLRKRTEIRERRGGLRHLFENYSPHQTLAEVAKEQENAEGEGQGRGEVGEETTVDNVDDNNGRKSETSTASGSAEDAEERKERRRHQRPTSKETAQRGASRAQQVSSVVMET